MHTPVVEFIARAEAVLRDNASLPFTPPANSPVGRAITEAGGKAAWERMDLKERQGRIAEVKTRHWKITAKAKPAAVKVAAKRPALTLNGIPRPAYVPEAVWPGIVKAGLSPRPAAPAAAAAGSKIMGRAQFDGLNARQKAAHFRTGGKLVDDAPHNEAAAVALAAPTKTRAQVDALTPAEKMEFFRNGGKLTD